MKRPVYVLVALAVTLLAVASPATAFARTSANKSQACVPFRPESGFYEAGRVGTVELVTPTSRCTTISVSNVRDPEVPTDRCQLFLVGFWPLVDGSLTYTEPVTACGSHRTVLARNVPNDAHYIIIYQVDYLIQTVTFRAWH